jgi:hypothetical protein
VLRRDSIEVATPRAPRPPRKLVAAFVLGLVFVASPRDARADCPDERDEVLCEPHGLLLQPSLSANALFTHGLGAYLGPGLGFALFDWKSPGEASGPSDGKIRLDVSVLVSERDTSRLAVPFRLGTALSFEQHASRRFLIPYFAADFGGLYESVLRTRMFVDAGLGLYLVHTRKVNVELEGTYLIPFSAVSELHGPKLVATATFAVF